MMCVPYYWAPRTTTIATPAPTAALANTPLHAWHAANKGRLVDFAGWEMPVQYGSIIEEHVVTRTAVGLYDVSHMGRLLVTGPQATEFLDSLLTRRIDNLKPTRIRYSLVCNESGGTLDDILAGRIDDDANGQPQFALVVNASNREKLVDWFNGHASKFDVTLTDQTNETAMIAVQGPEAMSLLEKLKPSSPLNELKYYQSCEATVGGVACSASRTGYTGEDGVELICSAKDALNLWEQLIGAGAKACGLAARDTLRLEAGMPLYGHELTEEISPVRAKLGFAINTEDRSFIGRDALVEAANDTTQTVRVGLEIDGRRPPREGYPVISDGKQVGWVSSGAPSPTLGTKIAMAFVPQALSAVGTDIGVDVRGTVLPAKVVALPFYRRS